jgi:hypothetical protein
VKTGQPFCSKVNSVDLQYRLSRRLPRTSAAVRHDATARRVTVERLTLPSAFTSFDDDFWEPIAAGGGRLGQAYLGLPKQAQHAVRARVLSQLPVQSSVEPFTLRHSAWIVAASVSSV